MEISNIIGWIAFVTASIMLMPQVIKVIVHKKVEDISLFMFAIASLNYLLWIIYGFLVKSPQVYIANILALTSALIVLSCLVINLIKNRTIKGNFSNDDQLNLLITEQSNPKTRNLDKKTTKEILQIINKNDDDINIQIRKEINSIEEVIDKIYENLSTGGRLFYVGAGTSGRLGILDASEIFPTYGIKDKIIGIIAGGNDAIKNPIEGSEDEIDNCVIQLKEYNFSKKDSLLAIAASGRTPCCIGSLEYANELGAFSSYLSMNKNSKFKKYTNYGIEITTGQETVTGSTRMKAGTATKMVLNMISTSLMIKSGYVIDNFMINMQISNEKLLKRAIAVVSQILNVNEEIAYSLLKENNFEMKKTIENKK